MRIFHNLILSISLLRIKWGSAPKFRKWLELESYKEKIIKAADGGDFPRALLKYLSVALGVRDRWIENADWPLLVSAFYVSLNKSPKVELPITTPSGEKPVTEDWSYDGRMWHLYSHMLAKAYGWTLEYISCLHVEEALAKIQEIIVDEQLEHEFVYGLSEMAYSYDKHTQKSKFIPLPRPSWMRPKAKPIKKFPIPVSMIPMGVVMTDGVLPDEFMPKLKN